MDANATSVNSCESQCERKCGKMKRVKDTRVEMLQELKQETKDMTETYVVVVGDFNEDVNAKNVQEFVVEMGLREVFREFHEVNDNDRDGTFECGTKCTDHVLVSEGMSNVVEGIELIEYNEIVDSEHHRCLTDLNLEACFEEDFNK